MDKERLAGNEAGVGRLTRRAFLGAGVAGTAALAGGRLESLFPVSTAEAADEPWIEATIPQLQALMAGGQLTSRERRIQTPPRLRRGSTTSDAAARRVACCTEFRCS